MSHGSHHYPIFVFQLLYPIRLSLSPLICKELYKHLLYFQALGLESTRFGVNGLQNSFLIFHHALFHIGLQATNRFIGQVGNFLDAALPRVFLCEALVLDLAHNDHEDLALVLAPVLRLRQ